MIQIKISNERNIVMKYVRNSQNNRIHQNKDMIILIEQIFIFFKVQHFFLQTLEKKPKPNNQFKI